MFKKFLVIFFILIFAGQNSFAELVVDDSIHSEISKKYELDKLPDLPNSLQNSTIDDIFTPNEFETSPSSKYIPSKDNSSLESKETAPPSQSLNYPESKKVSKPKICIENNSIKIKKGQKFRVVNSNELSDRLRKGAVITFVSTIAETNKYATIPKGTVFKGVVIDSHSPKYTGNGGLLVIKVNSMVYKNKTYPINAKVTIANQKHIFFNNIKGKRSYWKNAKNSTTKGKKFFDKMFSYTKKYFKPNVEIVFSVVSFVTGTVVYGVNIAVSPVLAIFTKGGKLYIPKNSPFEIKLIDDTYISP